LNSEVPVEEDHEQQIKAAFAAAGPDALVSRMGITILEASGRRCTPALAGSRSASRSAPRITGEPRRAR
jgi:hypothetical protein